MLGIDGIGVTSGGSCDLWSLFGSDPPANER